ncbi:MAG TPA: hypothetical protein PL059_03670 [Spirochaetota bacterium]|nr:hypothetical protein [Spirochaetota bacterium]HOM09252.1 hypothetical protein [Spirochaetota bacterium]HPP49052.1 hypothetical protein [Spirochaetota bacterium]
MFYNTASHLLFYSLLYGLDNFVSREGVCEGIALSPWQAGKRIVKKYYAEILLTKQSSKQYPVIITTDSEDIFKVIKDYIQQNISSIALRLSLLSKNNLQATFAFNEPLDHTLYDSVHILFSAYIRCKTPHLVDDYFTIYMPLELFTIFRVKVSNYTPYNSLNDIEAQFLQFFNDPYNLFPSLPIILETMEDNEFQKLIYFLLNEKILTPYHLYLLTRAFPQHALKIKYNISSNLISDILHVGKTIHRITARDMIEGIYAFEEILYLKLRTKPYFVFGNFIDQITNILHHIAIVSTFQKKTFETWLSEIEQSGLLYTILSHCDDITIATAFNDNEKLFNQLSRYLSSRRINSIAVYLQNKYTYNHTILSQYTIVQLYLKNMSHINKLYAMPFNQLLKKYIHPQMMYYILFDCGWFTIATALKQTPKKLVYDCIQKFPQGAQYCILDVYDGVLNPNIVHDEMQIKKARQLVIQSLIKLHSNGTIHCEV